MIEVKVGTSFISLEQARRNLHLELPGWDFERQRAALKDTWTRKLGALSVEGASDEQRHIFYTGLYHALLYPKLFSEHGRYYSAFDDGCTAACPIRPSRSGTHSVPRTAC